MVRKAPLSAPDPRILAGGSRLMLLTPEQRARKAARERTRRQNPEVRRRYLESQRRYNRKRKPLSAESRAKKAAYARKRNATPEARAHAKDYAAMWRENKLVTLAGRPRPEICDICGNENNNKKIKRIAFDHDHKDGHFRGWICDTCNYIIGLAKDDANYVSKIASYLRRTKDNVSPQLTLAGI